MIFKPGDKVVPNQKRTGLTGAFYGVDAWESNGNLVWFKPGDFGFVVPDPIFDGPQFIDMVFVLDVCGGREIVVFCDDLVLAEIQ